MYLGNNALSCWSLTVCQLDPLQIFLSINTLFEELCFKYTDNMHTPYVKGLKLYCSNIFKLLLVV